MVMRFITSAALKADNTGRADGYWVQWYKC